MTTRRRRRFILAATVTLWLSPMTASAVLAATNQPPADETRCGAPGDPRDGRADPDLYCIELVHTPDFPDASGHVELDAPPTPFGTAVTADGHHQFDLTIDLDGLPDPASLGPYTTYVAWVTTPLLRPMVNLGPVTNGRTMVGRVDFDKFLVLVTAESSPDLTAWEGRMLLRGISAGVRMEPEDLLALTGLIGSDVSPAPPRGWVRPSMHGSVAMMPGVADLSPQVDPFLPSSEAPVPPARPRETLSLADGSTLDLEAGLVERTINGRRFIMYGYNGQYPGPLIQVPQNATITVNVTNRLDLPTAVHWHGIRLENRFDGVPGVTQDPIEPGATFQYRIHFPDAGLYWYHPHHREDIQQDLGLYGNLRVDATDPDYFGPANREQVLMLDDLLVAEDGLVPFGRERATHALMGRFGNVLLVNGEPDYRLAVDRGEVVRFFLTNVSNTRTFNLWFGGATVKLVGSDVGKFERQAWVDSVVIAPAERYIVEVRFDDPGATTVANRVQGIDHVYGNFFQESQALGTVLVSDTPVTPDHAASFSRLRNHADVAAGIAPYRTDFDRPVDHRLLLTLEVGELPDPLETLLNLDRSFFNPVEWSGTMPRMNWVTTADQVRWVLRDLDTGLENTAIDWRFTSGDVVKVRLRNDWTAIHAMQHPVHIHGQRFLVLSRNGVPSDNLVWKDTMLLPVGSTADILLELSNPGRWMLHCHIAERLESGMKLVFDVAGGAPPRQP